MTYTHFDRLFLVETEDHKEVGRFVAYLYRDAINYDKAKALGLRVLVIGVA